MEAYVLLFTASNICNIVKARYYEFHQGLRTWQVHKVYLSIPGRTYGFLNSKRFKITNSKRYIKARFYKLSEVNDL